MSHGKESSGSFGAVPAKATAPDALRTDVPRIASDVALFLDFDGTLAPIAPHPGAVVVAPYLAPLLLRVRGYTRGALGLISGRVIADLDRLTRWTVQAAAGVHGLERRNASGQIVRSMELDARSLEKTRAALQRFKIDHPEVLIEDKAASIALHYRMAPAEADACDAFLNQFVTASSQFEVKRGACVVELKCAAENKGTALRAFLSEPPFCDRRPVFVGDDLADEDAFAEVRRHDGVAILVGPERPSAANMRLPTVQAVHSWLNALVS
jgi:trehalose 6-phosphate phosphatase